MKSSCDILLFLLGVALLMVAIIKLTLTGTENTPPENILRTPDLAYLHGIQVGQQMALAYSVSVLDREEARRACVKLIKEADEAGLGLNAKSLDEFRVK